MYRMDVVLMADDDADDCDLVATAFGATPGTDGCSLEFVGNGVELLGSLRGRGGGDGVGAASWPKLVLLDLNMPLMDGREALAEMKDDRRLRRIPVVVFSTSNAAEDMVLCYGLGAAGYIAKPPDFLMLVETVAGLCRYWHDTVLTPSNGE